MATLLDIRRRIRSVKNTQQITRAMKMVAAARLRRAQDHIYNARPYANEMLTLLSSLTARTEQRCHPLLEQRPIENILLVLVTADRGEVEVHPAARGKLGKLEELVLTVKKRQLTAVAGGEFPHREARSKFVSHRSRSFIS